MTAHLTIAQTFVIASYSKYELVEYKRHCNTYTLVPRFSGPDGAGTGPDDTNTCVMQVRKEITILKR